LSEVYESNVDRDRNYIRRLKDVCPECRTVEEKDFLDVDSFVIQWLFSQ
jgi:hypothetical protein